MKKVTCGWCCGGSVLDTGPGIFRDSDSDDSYGIPVCGGCGGLGFGFMDVVDYQERRGRIMKLRDEYCPVDDLPLPNLGVRLKALKELEREVKELYALYGDNQPCFAQLIVQGILADGIVWHEQKVEEMVAMYRDSTPLVDPDIVESIRAAGIAIVRGELDDAERLFQEAMVLKPQDSRVRHDYAVFVVNCLRDAEKALPHFQTACELEPKCATHFASTARCLILLKRRDPAIEYLKLAKNCPDVHELGPVLQAAMLAVQNLPTGDVH